MTADATASVPAGYVIARVTVTDPVRYEDYKAWSSAAMQRHGAEVCVRGGRLAVLEGDGSAGERVVVLKFASFDAAKAFYDSPEYGRARAAREGAAVMHMIAVEGVA